MLLTSVATANQISDSPFRKVGNIVYISGQIGINEKTGKMVSRDMTAQIKQTLENLQKIAKLAGGNLNDIIKLNVYMYNIDTAFPIVKNEIKHYFKPPYPARTPVGVSVTPLGPDGVPMLIEIDAVMALPPH